MIDLVTPVSRIAQLIPAALPSTQLGALPGFNAARPLADIVGVDPTTLLRSIEDLGDTGTLIDDKVVAATNLILSAGVDLGAIAEGFLSYAAARLGLLTNPLTASAAATDVGMQAVRSVAEAEERLVRLEGELAPHAAALEAVGAEAPVPQATAPAQVQPAGGEPVPAMVPAAEPVSSGDNAAGEAAVAAAKSQLGTPYVWGGSAPGGFDCSGLTSWAYSQAGVEIPRTAENQAIGQQVSYEELQAGDLIVWDGHVAMYTEDGMMIEAGDPVQMNPVRTENIGMGFKGFWRPTA